MRFLLYRKFDISFHSVLISKWKWQSLSALSENYFRWCLWSERLVVSSV
jgi:hypothetical protein